MGWTDSAGAKAIGNPFDAVVGNSITLPGYQFATEFGHGTACAVTPDGSIPSMHQRDTKKLYDEWMKAREPDMVKRLGPLRAQLHKSIWDCTIFPNCSFLRGIDTWKVWQPRGPRELDIWSWVLVEKDMPDELKQMLRHSLEMTFGAAGMFEGDDGENMEGCTWGGQGFMTQQDKLFMGMGVEKERRHESSPGLTTADHACAETPQRNFLRFWSNAMSSDTWDQIREKEFIETKRRESLPQRAAEV